MLARDAKFIIQTTLDNAYACLFPAENQFFREKKMRQLRSIADKAVHFRTAIQPQNENTDLPAVPLLTLIATTKKGVPQ